MKASLLKVLLLVLFLLSTTSIMTFAEEEIDIEDYAQNMQPGWNLGNSYDAVGEDETAWGNPFVTKALIQKVAAEGFRSIRIPITFDQRMAAGPDYTIEQDFLNRIDQTINWALEEGLYVMINVHHDSWIWMENGMETDHDNTVKRYRAIWTQLADRYKNYSTKVMFESINEPRFAVEENEQQHLDELNEAFYQIVRNSGGSNDIRPLVLPTLDTGQEPEKLDGLSQFISELNDPNIIATVHYYGFWPFSVNIAGYTRFNEEVKQDIIDNFDRVYNTFAPHNIPVVIGEYGLLGFDRHTGVIQQGEKLKFFEYMLHYAQEKGFVHMLWDNGQHLGRTSLEWADPELIDMIQTSWETRSALPNENFIYLKKGEEITDKTISFEFNSHTINQILLDGEPLRAAEDYTVSSDAVTFHQELLASVVDPNQTGNQATLTVDFSGGFDWDIDIINYQTPLLEDAVGTTESFQIPTAFNGDQLATMEAYYPDGSIAGPQNWTGFKEFDYTFSPNYENRTIELKQNFFQEVNDSEVQLTFHFWSGEKVDYTIVKNGTSIEGTSGQSTPAPPEKDTEKEPEPKPDPEDSNDETEKEEDVPEGIDDEDKHLERNNEENEKNEKTEDSEAPNKETQTKEQTTDFIEEQRLPDTATQQYNFLFGGIILLVLGIGLFIWRRKKII